MAEKTSAYEQSSAYEQLLRENESNVIKIISADLDRIAYSHLGKTHYAVTHKLIMKYWSPLKYYITNPSALKNVYERVDVGTLMLLYSIFDTFIRAMYDKELRYSWVWDDSISQCQELKIQLTSTNCRPAAGIKTVINLSVKVKDPKKDRIAEVIGPGLVEKNTSHDKSTCIESTVLSRVSFKEIKDAYADIHKKAVCNKIDSLVKKMIESVKRVST